MRSPGPIRRSLVAASGGDVDDGSHHHIGVAVELDLHGVVGVGVGPVQPVRVVGEIDQFRDGRVVDDGVDVLRVAHVLVEIRHLVIGGGMRGCVTIGVL